MCNFIRIPYLAQQIWQWTIRASTFETYLCFKMIQDQKFLTVCEYFFVVSCNSPLIRIELFRFPQWTKLWILTKKNILLQLPWTLDRNTVRAGIMGQISALTLDCGAMGFLSVLFQRRDWLILILNFIFFLHCWYIFHTLPVYPKNLTFLSLRFCG